MKLASEEARAFGVGAAALPYLLRRSVRRRSLAVRVNDAGGVVVNAPMRLAQRDIDAFLVRHRDWIVERQARAHANAFHWQDGAVLPWLGGNLRLTLHPVAGRPVLRREGEHLLCHAAAESLAALVPRWYRLQARALLRERLDHHAARAGYAPPPLRLSDARTRWGSLSAKGLVSLNWRLLKAPPETIDYVICHELAHFRQRNHSPAFWQEVALLFPDWKRVRGELRRNGRIYFQF